MLHPPPSPPPLSLPLRPPFPVLQRSPPADLPPARPLAFPSLTGRPLALPSLTGRPLAVPCLTGRPLAGRPLDASLCEARARAVRQVMSDACDDGGDVPELKRAAVTSVEACAPEPPLPPPSPRLPRTHRMPH